MLRKITTKAQRFLPVLFVYEKKQVEPSLFNLKAKHLLSANMFYREHLDEEDNGIITFESDNEDWSSNSIVESPIINENTVIELLHDSSTIEPQKSNETTRTRNRDKFKGLLRTLSWKKTGSTPKTLLKEPEEAMETKADESLVIDGYIDGHAEPLAGYYDNTISPVHEREQYNQDFLNFNQDQENIFKRNVSKESLTSLNGEDSILTPSKRNETVNSRENSPKRTLSRRFSIFSLKSRPSTANLDFNIDENLSYFEDLNVLSAWRLPKFEKPKILLEKNPKNNKDDANTIFFFMNYNKTSKEKESFLEDKCSKNIDRLIYYPYTKAIVESCFGENMDYSELVQNDEELTLFFNKNCLKENSFDKKDNNNKKKTPISEYHLRSLHLQETLQEYRKQKLDTKPSYITTTAVKQLNQMNSSLDIWNLVNLQIGFKPLELSRPWNIWIGSFETRQDGNSKRKKFKMYSKIYERSQLANLQTKYEELVENYVYDKDKELIVYKNEDKPIFHGREKDKSYGKYIYIIPLTHSRQVWEAILELLLTERLNQTSVGYEVSGISWRRYSLKGRYGFHLTLYVDERNDYDLFKIKLFLSEILMLAPDGVKHCFQRNKSILPGEGYISIYELD